MNFLCHFHSCTVYEIKLIISAYIFLQDLLYPPSNISLHPTGEVGQLLVEWKRPKNGWIPGLYLQYEIRYSSKNTSSTVGPVSLSLTQTQNIEILLYILYIEALHLLNAIYTHSSQISKHRHKLVSLVAGENCTVQMRVKPGGDSKQFWSDWSSPVTAMVPQTAGES